MKEARRRAAAEHVEIERRRALKPSKRPSRAVTSRQISSKRSAEICRAKMGIYITVLEEQVRLVAAQSATIETDLATQAGQNAELQARIDALESQSKLQQQDKQVQDTIQVDVKHDVPHLQLPIIEDVPTQREDDQLSMCSGTTQESMPYGVDSEPEAPCYLERGTSSAHDAYGPVADSTIEDFEQFMSSLSQKTPQSPITPEPFMFDNSQLMGEPF